MIDLKLDMTGYIGKAVIRVGSLYRDYAQSFSEVISSMGLSNIRVNVSQGIATITLNEPQRLNALSAAGLPSRSQVQGY
jgi:hypothetical protein